MPNKKTETSEMKSACCGGGSGCGCDNGGGCCCGGGYGYGWPRHRHGFWYWVGKMILMIVFFVLVWCTIRVACHCGGMRGRGGMMMNRPQMTFDARGCLDTSAIKCPMMLQRVQAADANKDGCITRDELRAAWKDARGMTGDRPGADCDME
ncbi:MAG: hypothetical protein FWC51_02050 [Proteobacteria bacterium]|nr:hypothetical protein [Pseudomonadota bacterium]